MRSLLFSIIAILSVILVISVILQLHNQESIYEQYHFGTITAEKVSVSSTGFLSNFLSLLGFGEPIVTVDFPNLESGHWLSSITVDGQCPVSKSSGEKQSGCRLPEIDPFHPSIMKYINEAPYPHCPGTTYGTLSNGVLTFTDPKVKSASYKPILRSGDFDYSLGSSVEIQRHDSQKINDSFIEVSYKLSNGDIVKDYLYQVLRSEDLLTRKAAKQPGIPRLNILVLGIDSVSLANTQRSLIKLYKYITTELDALVFKGHAIVGEDTLPQLTAMLTGKHVKEQYEAKRGETGAKPLDGWNWIFRDLKDHGYLTGFSEDGVVEGPFQARLMGFDQPPVDFYPRSYFLDVASKIEKTSDDRCIGNRNIAQIHLDYVKEVFDAYPEKLKFFMSFNAAFSHHAINGARKNERDLLSLIKYLRKRGHLNNTLLIVMGDNGFRHGEIRTEVQGKLEERLPLFSMIFPPFFREKFPHLMKILKTNTERLTSWFDVYVTLRHILSYPALPRNVNHGASLLREVPANRTCESAGVAKHCCPCLQWETVDVAHPHVEVAAGAAVEFMNYELSKDEESENACRTLLLKKVNFAQLERPNSAVRALHGGENTEQQATEYFCRYQVRFITEPNQGMYEAIVKYYQQRFLVVSDISRINQYGGQPQCIADKLPQLQKYCFCKNYQKKLL